MIIEYIIDVYDKVMSLLVIAAMLFGCVGCCYVLSVFTDDVKARAKYILIGVFWFILCLALLMVLVFAPTQEFLITHYGV
jgi:hypothetical protein